MGAKKPYVVAFLIQATYAGNVLLSKAAFNAGMSTFVFVFYRQFAGTLFLLPFAIVFERKSPNPLSMAIFCKIFMLAFLGITLSLNVYGVALVYTSANLGATTINCLPVTTFAFAVLLGMEKVNIRTAPGIAKVAGIVVCMAGVAVLAFYKGAHLKPLVHHGLEFGHGNRDHHDHVSSAKRMLGCFLLLVSSMCWGLWLVLQAQILNIYPSKLAFTSLQCLSSAIQSFLLAVAFKRDLRDWKLAWNVRLLSVLYCGILVTGLAYYLQTWVVSMKGPVFLAMTTPLCLIMTILGSMFVLGEVINLGSVLGGVLLVISLYSVLWGKSKEERMENQLLPVQDEEKSTDLKETEASIAKPTSLAQNM
ncbi:WAT1-related protein At5g64700-like isoform X1 [Durio zibethinus]|uniref:WAT1-related protein n=1 Tax=Durio zibethinus TaxID=66656 RepID=A0A6P5YKL9_DURZI|nr:WAT1-related protein At5g64700-like isoform X1 [Durio zibethinus]